MGQARAIARWVHVGVAVALAVGAVVAATPAGSAAAAAPVTLPAARATYASAFQPPAGMAGSAAFDPTNSTASGYAHTAEVAVVLNGGTGGSGSLELDMRAPDGQTFQAGRTYAGDDVYGVRGLGEVSNGTSCEGVAFTIVDIASSGTTVTRLDLTYRTSCAVIGPGYAFGQLLLGEPSPVAGGTVSADRLTWPVVPVGLTSPAVAPVRIVNTGRSTMSLGSAQVTGAAAADYAVTASTCGTSLPAGAACVLSVSFTPHAAGDRPALLGGTIGSTTVGVALDGLAPPGRTLFRATSQAGDYVGQGKKYLITDAQSPFVVTSLGSGSIDLTTSDGPSAWFTRIITPDGGPITLGTHAADHTGASKYYLVVTGEGNGCADATGSLTVKQIGFAADGSVSAFDADFVQRCVGSTAALTGEIAWRATTPTPPQAAARFLLQPGASLTAGHALIATWGTQPAYRLTLTPAGDLVLHDDDRGVTLWDSHTVGTGAVLTMQRSGRLVLTDAAGRTLWSTGTHVANSIAVLQGNGDLVVNNPAYQPVFHTGTAQKYV